MAGAVQIGAAPAAYLTPARRTGKSVRLTGTFWPPAAP